MITLFNESWSFALLPIDSSSMYKDGNPVLFDPEDYLSKADSLSYNPVSVPHDWLISDVKDLYKNSVGFYQKKFNLKKEEKQDRYIALRFEGVYMNSGVWVNGKLAGKCKYGYSTCEYDITNLVQEGENKIIVIAVYQNCNTRWYSGAGIFRDVHLINSPFTHLTTDGTYIVTKPNAKSLSDLDAQILSKDLPEALWTVKISTEVAGPISGHKVRTTIKDMNGKVFASSMVAATPLPVPDAESEYLHQVVPSLSFNQISKTYEEMTVTNPHLWDIVDPYFYTATTTLLDKDNNEIDSITQHCGFKIAQFTKDKGFFLNGNHIKIQGACQHHDLGALGSAFDVNALRRQFAKLKEMGVNSVRCSHNPPAKAFMNLADEMGLMIDDEAFDMWEKPKTPFDYGNYFNDNFEKDVASWVRRDRNHPCLIMWSIGNEIYDTHQGNGLQITKNLYNCVVKNDPERVAPVTIASNYMMTDGAQECAKEIDTVGYNYLERLYDDHHKKYPEWKIYGSETGSTVQSRGIYHFPESLQLVTFSDGQCSTLGNCTVPWGCPNTQTLITFERDCDFSAGQYIWTGWDYIGEPTPYHTKNSYFGQIDTAGFPKDTFWLYKSEWAYKQAEPFVHILPYWDWNEGQIIDVKAYTNCEAVELFFEGKSLGKHKIDHEKDKEPFGRWQIEYHKGELKAVAYDKRDRVVATEVKKSFDDPFQIILEPENYSTGNLHFVDIMTADKNDVLVENARNYITVNVCGDAKLIGMDNGDSTDYEEYQPKDGNTHSRKLFSNRLVAVIRTPADCKNPEFTVTAASKDLPNVAITYKNGKWKNTKADSSIVPEKDFVPARKIEIISKENTNLTKDNPEITVTCKVLPKNASIKEINWNPVLKECVPSDYIKVLNKTGVGSGEETATIKAFCDGECILRCTAKNGTELDEVLSDLPFSVQGLGNPKLDPYKIIEACRLTDWDQQKRKPPVCLESGISTRETGPNWISFDMVDFGSDGADTIHIPIFTFDTQAPVEIWDGKPENGTTDQGGIAGNRGKCIGKFTYNHESIYNVYSENVFTLDERLFGIHTISVVFPRELYFHGFYFDKTPKATAKLRALDATLVSGDSFKKTETAVEEIGNNVSLDFENMDFGSSNATKLTICGKSNTENNTINIKFFGKDGNNSTQVIEFAHTSDYEEKSFDLSPVSGMQKISFVFLPGSNFDFKWFRFE